MITNAKTKCFSCNSAVSVKESLDCAQKAWSGKGWILYACPYCKAGNHIKVHNDIVFEGHLDGFPAPRFIKTASLAVNGLKVEVSGILKVSTADLLWEIPEA